MEKNSEYWEKRIASETWKVYNSLEEKNKELLQFYIEASENVKNELYRLAEKYSKDEVLSLSEMHKQNRLTELNQKYEKIIEELGHTTEEFAKKNMQQGFQDVYEKTAKGMGDNDFSMPNKKLMEKMMETPWRGDNFSGRLWKNQKKLAVSLNDVLLTGLQQGKTVTEIAISLHNRMGQGFNECHRLVRTETMHYLNDAALHRYKDAGVEYVQIWAALDERTCDTCGGYHEKIYPIDKCPHVPLHANCRCTVLPFVDENVIAEYEKEDVAEISKDDRMKVKEYLKFETGSRANNFFYGQKKYETWEKSLDDLQKQVIKDYAYTDYQIINYYLRMDNEKDENIKLDKRLYGNKREEQIKAIDKVISSFELTDNIVVHRNVDAELFMDYFDDTQALVGKEFIEKGYASTSVIKTGAMSNKDCKIDICIPAGKGRGAYINKLSNYKDTEYEFLIARGGKFRITEVKETDELILKMEMIVDE